jgi:hypothetical protein
VIEIYSEEEPTRDRCREADTSISLEVCTACPLIAWADNGLDADLDNAGADTVRVPARAVLVAPIRTLISSCLALSEAPLEEQNWKQHKHQYYKQLFYHQH